MKEDIRLLIWNCIEKYASYRPIYWYTYVHVNNSLMRPNTHDLLCQNVFECVLLTSWIFAYCRLRVIWPPPVWNYRIFFNMISRLVYYYEIHAVHLNCLAYLFLQIHINNNNKNETRKRKEKKPDSSRRHCHAIGSFYMCNIYI